MLFNRALWAPGLARVLDTSLRYTVDKTSREVLFLPLPAELKYRAKPFIDVTMDRFAKGMGALLILVGAFLGAGINPLEAVETLLRGSLGRSSAITGTLRETTPLLLAGMAVFLALRAGLFNIGVEGQLLVGAAATVAVALALPGIPGLLLGSLAGMVAGAVWAFPAGWIRAYRNGHEVITTIMLNSVAVFMTGWLVAGPMKAANQESPTTSDISGRIPNLVDAPVTVNLALILGIAVAGVLHFWLRRTVAGYELQAVGANPTAARFAGIDPRRVMVRAMTGSGAIAGLAGAMQVLAYEGRFYSGFSPGYGFDALGVALLAGSSSLAVVPCSLLFGMLAKGGTALQIDGVPKGITTVVLGLLIMIAAAVRYRRTKVV
jgi:simple sugar transport system permease protein